MFYEWGSVLRCIFAYMLNTQWIASDQNQIFLQGAIEDYVESVGF